MRFRQSQSVSLTLPEEIWSVAESASEWLDVLLGPKAHSGVPVEYLPNQKAEVLREALKITQHGMVKRRSYGSMWQLSLFVSHNNRNFNTKMNEESFFL